MAMIREATSSAESRFALQKDRMLKAAAYCFNQKGFSGTSLKDVARRLGLTDAALYYYVRNKEELVYLCYLRAADVGREAMEEAAAADGDGLARVRDYLRRHIGKMVGSDGPIAIMSEIPSLQPAHRDDVLERSRAHSRAFEKMLGDGIGDRSIVECDVRMAGNAIMGAVNWIPKWHHGDAAAAARIVREFPDILTRAIAARADSPSARR